MADTKDHSLIGVAETSLVTLYLRAEETQRSDALLRDPRALSLVEEMSYDFEKVRQLPLSEVNKVSILMRCRRFDQYAQDFMASHSDAVVVHIGCGLDARFERVDNGLVTWYDLDLPPLIELRKDLIGGESERYRLLGNSVLDDGWWCELKVRSRPVMFIAEGVLVYFQAEQVKNLIHKLRSNFPGAELVFDGFSPIHVLFTNLQMSNAELSGLFPRLHWGLWSGATVEKWGEGIKLLGEWGFFDAPEPRMDFFRWFKPLDRVLRTMRLFHFRLGTA